MDELRKNRFGVEIGDTFFRLLLLHTARAPESVYIFGLFFLSKL